MNSVLESVATSKAVRSAERVVIKENRRLAAEDKKRRLLVNHFANTEIKITSSSSSNPQSAGESETSVAVPPGLAGLVDTGHIFLRRAGTEFVEKYFDLPNRYDLLNSDGEIILYAGETREEFGAGKDCFGTHSPVFDVSILGLQGGGLLSINSHRRVTTISDFRSIIGTVIDTGTPFGPHERYSIRDWNMSEVFQLRHSRNEPRGEFDVFNNTGTFVAKFTSNWNTDLPNYIGVDKLYGGTFPPDMDLSEKVLLLGTLFAMVRLRSHVMGSWYYQNLHGDVTDRNGKFWAYCILITAISLFLLIVIGILMVAFLA